MVCTGPLTVVRMTPGVSTPSTADMSASAIGLSETINMKGMSRSWQQSVRL